MGELDGKVAVVTGVASKRGIGHAIVLRLAQEGADLVINDIPLAGIRPAEANGTGGWQGLRDVEAEIRALGRKVLANEADITSSQQVEELVAKCLAQFGKIDILVNNAGISGPTGTRLVDLPENVWDKIMMVNLKGAFLCSKAVAKRMLARGEGGKIINIASFLGKRADIGWGAYSTSKFGVVGLTQNLALELAKDRICVNAVCPGVVHTEIVDAWAEGEIKHLISKGISAEEATAKTYAYLNNRAPLRRMGQPEDVAKVVAFLASSESDYMTGQAINVTGGLLMCH